MLSILSAVEHTREAGVDAMSCKVLENDVEGPNPD
jgi:hypothetical protein